MNEVIEEKVQGYYKWMEEFGYRTDTSGARKSLEYWIAVMEELLKTYA